MLGIAQLAIVVPTVWNIGCHLDDCGDIWGQWNGLELLNRAIVGIPGISNHFDRAQRLVSPSCHRHWVDAIALHEHHHSIAIVWDCPNEDNERQRADPPSCQKRHPKRRKCIIQVILFLPYPEKVS